MITYHPPGMLFRFPKIDKDRYAVLVEDWPNTNDGAVSFRQEGTLERVEKHWWWVRENLSGGLALGFLSEVYGEEIHVGTKVAEAKTGVKELYTSELLKTKNLKIDLPYQDRQFQTIEADFPWRYDDFNMNGYKGSKRWRNHTNYNCVPLPVLYNTAHEITRISRPNSHLYFWAPDAFLFDAALMLSEAGWKVKQYMVWVKTNDGTPQTPKLLPGHYFRRCKECCIFAVRADGKPPQPHNHAYEREVFFYRKLPQHSHKPAEFYDLIKRNSEGPRVSLFQRREIEGFEVFGDELGE